MTIKITTNFYLQITNNFNNIYQLLLVDLKLYRFRIILILSIIQQEYNPNSINLFYNHIYIPIKKLFKEKYLYVY